MNVYKRGMETCAPFYTVKTEGEIKSFDGGVIQRYEIEIRHEGSKKRPNKNYRDIKNKNYYVKIRREEETEFEMRIILKCKEEPKMFHKFVNGMLKETKV